MASTPPGGTRNLRDHSRFRLGDAKILVYPESFLAKLGLKRKNLAKDAVNLSEGGILVQLGRRVEPKTIVRIRLALDAFDEVIEGTAEVRWCGASSREPGTYYAGLRFKEIDPSCAGRIKKMRGWFDSPEFKMKTRVRQKSGDGPSLVVDR